MDPYVERNWRDFHTTLIVGAREVLNRVLPPDLVARTEERVYVESESEPIRRVNPDVRVSSQRPLPQGAEDQSAIAVAEPVMIEADDEPVTERFIQILEKDGGRVVTAIEFVSPANKRPGDEGRQAYLTKRREFLDSDTNLVEIDLTRSGDWLGMMRPYRVPERYRTTYRALVRRAGSPRHAQLYPITLRQRLPAISIPLRASDADAKLDLQELFERAYDTGRYAGTDYTRPLDPPLSPEEAEWAQSLLRAGGHC